jgi:type IV pilus assembly protein PilF
MKRALLLVLLFQLAACAQQPSSQGKDTEILESANPRARVHTELAAQYYARRQYPVALQELRESLQSDAAYAPAYNMLGLVHAALLEEREADDSFRRALDLAPQYSEAHNNYGQFLCATKRRAEAMEHFEQAWKNPLYGNPEKALANAGFCILRQGDTAEAERYAQRALVRMPGQPLALAVLAEIQLLRGNTAMARTMLRQLETQGPLDAGALWLGIRVERAAGNREAEASYGLQLRRRYPDSPETTWLLAGQYDMPEGRR